MRHSVPLVLLSVLLVFFWWWPNRLQDPLPGTHAQKFNSLSYEGYRTGESPLTDRFATAAEVDEDLSLLAPITRGIRTYAAIEGPYDIAAIAQRHGLKMWQGVWLGTDRAKNKLEMSRAIDLAHRYPDTIERLVVGNEVLLRRDLPPAELAADIDRVRAAVHQPVAYADVSDFWDQFPQIADHVDVVMIHLLPYWEDVPTGIGHAVATIGSLYDHFSTLLPAKRISIGETGWPSCCRQRRDALPSRINQARFLRGFIALAAKKHFDYNFFEAFDEDWKYENEGIVGANWGLFSAARADKIPPSGPLSENPLWPRYAAIGVGVTWLLAWLGRRNTSAHQTALLAATLGGAISLAWADWAPVTYDIHVNLAACVNLFGQGLLAALAMRRLAGLAPPDPARTGAQATWRVIALLRLRRPGWHGLFEDLSFVFVWAAAVDQLLLVFDPRYREFPVATYAVPLVVTAARATLGDLPRGTGRREEALLACTLGLGAIASAVQEGALNTQSLTWNACALVLSWPLWTSLRRTRPIQAGARTR